jgi:hypothetical protein
MFKLEHASDDLQAAAEAKPQISKLFNRNENVWKDCYEANSALRKSFRVCIRFKQFDIS